MRFSRYPEYKASGADWVPSLPTPWKIGALRWLSRRYSGGTPDKSNKDFWENGTIPWLNSGAVNHRRIKTPSTYITEDAFNSSSAKWIPSGALVVALAGQGKTKGMVAHLEIESTCNQSMAAIIPRLGFNSRYLFWWLDCNYENIRNMAGGDLRDGLNLEMLGNIRCPIPSIDEQEIIANFLEHETAKIDSLVAEQERLIELLTEKRQSLISHAVTKGLYPSVKMKKSNIDLLGLMPEHWQIGGLTRFIGPIVDYRGRTPTKVDDGIFLVTARNIRNGKIDYEASEEFVDPESATSLLNRGAPEIGDLLFTMEAPLGQVALIDRTDIALAQRIVKFRVIPDVMTSKFLLYWLMSDACQARLETLATGSTALGIKASKLGQIECLVPPIAEQNEIVAHIEMSIEKADALISEAQVSLGLLAERRSSLISAAVTGQIDVRNVAI